MYEIRPLGLLVGSEATETIIYDNCDKVNYKVLSGVLCRFVI